MQKSCGAQLWPSVKGRIHYCLWHCKRSFSRQVPRCRNLLFGIDGDELEWVYRGEQSLLETEWSTLGILALFLMYYAVDCRSAKSLWKQRDWRRERLCQHDREARLSFNSKSKVWREDLYVGCTKHAFWTFLFQKGERYDKEEGARDPCLKSLYL